jgi:CDP-diacylglycerol---glycerol-3-phosphate 3-phosphatidyltransferase
LLISAAMISLVQVRMLPGWLVILVISREFAVSGLRSIAAAEGYTIKASELGKTKMVMQVTGVALVMMTARWPQLELCAMTAVWGAVVFGLWSAGDYFWKFWKLVDLEIKLRGRHELIMMERRKRRLERAHRSAARAREASIR